MVKARSLCPDSTRSMLVLVLGEVDVGLVGGALFALLDGLAARLLDGLLQHLGHHGAAVELLDMRDRHLALAEALELDLVPELVEPRGEALAELALADDDLELALETGAGNSLICMISASTIAFRRDRSAVPVRYQLYPSPAANARGAGGGTRTPTTCVTGT